jgi:hypothetical protein
MTTWLHSTTHDTGNGAIITRSYSAQYPGVMKIEFHSYCGREADKTWYEAQGDPNRVEFFRPSQAAQHFRKIPV